MEKKIDFLALYQRLFQTLSHGKMQEVMDVSYEITGVPILAVDIAYNLLGAVPKNKTGDYYWDYLVEHKRYDMDMTVQLYTDGIMQSVNEKEAPYIVDWGAATEEFPKILGVIKINNIVEGYVVMQCKKGEITEERMKAMSIIQEACSLMLKGKTSENSMESVYLKTFINELFNGRIVSEKQLDLWRKNSRFFPKPPYRIITVNTNSSSEKNVLSYISKYFQNLFSDQMLLIQDRVLYILQYSLLPKMTQMASNELYIFLCKFNAHCGVSNSFENLLDIGDYKIQAADAMCIGKRLDAHSRIHFYKDYYLPAILMPRINEMPRNNYISPVIEKLREYDKKHSTDFLDTLKVYIRNLCSTSDSAAQLHIHRNSFLYRINKIEEVTGVDLREYHTFIHLAINIYIEEI